MTRRARNFDHEAPTQPERPMPSWAKREITGEVEKARPRVKPEASASDADKTLETAPPFLGEPASERGSGFRVKKERVAAPQERRTDPPGRSNTVKTKTVPREPPKPLPRARVDRVVADLRSDPRRDEDD